MEVTTTLSLGIRGSLKFGEKVHYLEKLKIDFLSTLTLSKIPSMTKVDVIVSSIP